MLAAVFHGLAIIRSVKAIALLFLALALPSWAVPRSAAEKLAFQRENPCPATGARRGRCPGYVIDHVVPLCAGGPDHRSNMQWQEYGESLVKDREERRECRALRRR